MKKVVLSIILANLLVACASDKPKEEVSEPAAATSTESTADAATAPAETASTSAAPVAAEADAAAAEAAAASAAAANEVADLMEKRSVFFPFDVDAVQAADRDTIAAHGAYLGKNKNAKVRVEGNADERGSSEYNLGLGQRRANNVRKALILAGARSSQIETVSFGEEKPRASGHDEESWAQNRRADIVYTAK
ncbi:MAG TPA: peptidoglycan-associated lipoprotein Pal [Sideroxyarcus sp.]|nr:peptidoglycan-associated lipoprotein Pal [Sideroxyarcus sp.]